MPSKKIEEMTEEELLPILQRQLGFEEDEIRSLFPKVEDMREALQHSQNLQSEDGDSLGWDKKDDQRLNKDQKRAVSSLVEQRKLREEAKKRVAKRQEEENVSAVTESIKETNAPVTAQEVQEEMKKVKSALKDVSALLEEDD